MNTSMYLFASDLVDEGVDEVLDRFKEAGLDEFSLASVYHASRDVFPHSPRARVRYLEGCTAYFQADLPRYADVGFAPRVSEMARDRDPLADACRAAAERDLAVSAWTVFLHTDRPHDTPPELAPQNVFGDPYLTELCPANPAVRAYAAAVASDVARYDVSSIVAEALHFLPLEHGYHHERYFFDLGTLDRFLLGLCFCSPCMTAAENAGVDAAALKRFTRETVERAFRAETPVQTDELSRDAIGQFADGELAEYLRVRERTVTSLAAEVVDSCDCPVSFMDGSGAVKGYVTGRPTGDPAASIAWRLGIDIGELARVCSGFDVIAYAADPARVRLDLDAYRALVPGDTPLRVSMRPVPPDCDSAENLAEKIAVAREAQASTIAFYHYGLAPLNALDRIQDAVAAAGD